MARSAQSPWLDGRPPHLPVARGALPPVCLLPGDPARVDLTAQVLADFQVLGQNREFRVGVGTLDGTRIGVCSTGIGGPSTEIAVAELAQLGVETVLRTGGMGALTEAVAPGSVCAVTRAVPGSGAAAHYAGADRAREADDTVLAALHEQAGLLGVGLTDITVATTDSYYLGQGRPLPGLADRAAERMAELLSSGVDGVDMEAETVLAVARTMGIRAGAVLVAHANRATDAWLEDYEPAQLAMLRVAVRAAVALSPAAEPRG